MKQTELLAVPLNNSDTYNLPQVSVLFLEHLSNGIAGSPPHGRPGVATPWHLNSQTVSLLIPLENDIGGRRSCVTICFPPIVPPVQVEAPRRQS